MLQKKLRLHEVVLIRQYFGEITQHRMNEERTETREKGNGNGVAAVAPFRATNQMVVSGDLLFEEIVIESNPACEPVVFRQWCCFFFLKKRNATWTHAWSAPQHPVSASHQFGHELKTILHPELLLLWSLFFPLYFTARFYFFCLFFVTEQLQDKSFEFLVLLFRSFLVTFWAGLKRDTRRTESNSYWCTLLYKVSLDSWKEKSRTIFDLVNTCCAWSLAGHVTITVI